MEYFDIKKFYKMFIPDGIKMLKQENWDVKNEIIKILVQFL